MCHFCLQDNWSALLYSAKEGHLEIVIELLERGANLEHRDLVRILFLMQFLLPVLFEHHILYTALNLPGLIFTF